MTDPTERARRTNILVLHARRGDRLLLHDADCPQGRPVTVAAEASSYNGRMVTVVQDLVSTDCTEVGVDDVRFWLSRPDPDVDEPPQVNEPLQRAADKARQVVRAEVTLDPSDPFEAALADIVAMNRKKRADYTSAGSSPWENFDRTEDQVGGDAVETLIATKQARLRALRLRGETPKNEPVVDSKLDRAVYSIISYARHLYPDGKVKP